MSWLLVKISFSNLNDIFLQQGFFSSGLSRFEEYTEHLFFEFFTILFRILCSFCINGMDASLRPPLTSASVFVAWVGGVEQWRDRKRTYSISQALDPAMPEAMPFPESFPSPGTWTKTFPFCRNSFETGLSLTMKDTSIIYMQKFKNAKKFSSPFQNMCLLLEFSPESLSQAESKCDKYPRRRWGQALLPVIAGGQWGMPPGTSSQIISDKSSYWSLTFQADCMRVFSGYPHSNLGF